MCVLKPVLSVVPFRHYKKAESAYAHTLLVWAPPWLSEVLRIRLFFLEHKAATDLMKPATCQKMLTLVHLVMTLYL